MREEKGFQGFVPLPQASESFQRGDHLTRVNFSPPFVVGSSLSEEGRKQLDGWMDGWVDARLLGLCHPANR